MTVSFVSIRMMSIMLITVDQLQSSLASAVKEQLLVEDAVGGMFVKELVEVDVAMQLAQAVKVAGAVAKERYVVLFSENIFQMQMLILPKLL